MIYRDNENEEIIMNSVESKSFETILKNFQLIVIDPALLD